jgi:ubiquinone biosynthesis protein UbiJ
VLERFDQTASRAAATAANHVLAQAAWACTRLKPYAGRTVHVRAAPLALALTVTAEGQWQAAAPGTAADLTVHVTPVLLARLALRDAGAWRGVVFDGDSAFARDLAFVGEHLRWDAEEDLSRVVGDIAAHRVAQTARTLARWPRESFGHLAQSFAAYWTEEQPLIAGRGDVAAFNRAVDELRDGVARLDARLSSLSPH